MSNNTRISDKDITMWGQYLAAKRIPEGASKDQIKRLAARQVNLGDASAVATLIARMEAKSMEQALAMTLQKVNVLESLLMEKLDITDEEMLAHEESYEQKMAELFSEIVGPQGEE